ncbi:MAG TPA: PAS domain S-box protein, partial [Thermodesulfovibrionales bacterium]|nr:PAS domain S-box protein [Thermodesulfovibrionales bacterium]
MQTEDKIHTIPFRLLLVFLLLSVGIAAVGYFFYQKERWQIRKTGAESLAAIADLKVKQIRDWQDERTRDASFILNDTRIAEDVAILCANPSAAGAREATLNWMSAMYKNGQYSDMYLVDSKGKVLLSVPEEEPDATAYPQVYLRDALVSKRILFSDFRRSDDKNIYIDIVVPIVVGRAGEKSPVGAVVLRIEPHGFLYPLIESWPTPSRTAESLLVRREGDEVIFLNDLRHKSGTALSLRFPADRKDLPAAMAVQGKKGVIEGIDYRGIPVVAALQAVPDSPWFLVAKVDMAEIYEPNRILFRLIGLLTGLLIMASGLSVVLFWRHQQLQFSEGQSRTEKSRMEILQKYEHLTKYANDIILLVDREHKIIDANERALTSYGYGLEEIKKLSFEDLLQAGRQTEIGVRLSEVEARNGHVYESEHRRKDGTTFPVEISSRVIDIEGSTFYQNIIRDIT